MLAGTSFPASVIIVVAVEWCWAGCSRLSHSGVKVRGEGQVRIRGE